MHSKQSINDKLHVNTENSDSRRIEEGSDENKCLKTNSNS